MSSHDMSCYGLLASTAQCDQFQEISNRLKWRKKMDIESEIMLQDDCRNMYIANKNFYITILGYYSVVDNCFRIPMIINT